MNSEALLLRDLRKHVASCNPGSEPFASGLKAVAECAWRMLNLREVEWSALGGKVEYSYIVHTYVATSAGVEETYSTPAKPPKDVEQTPYQKTQWRIARKVLTQFTRHCRWVYDRFCDALDNEEVTGRNRLRCLTGRAAFDKWASDRFLELQARKFGQKIGTESRFGKFAERHGQVHAYRDNLYVSKAEAQAAERADRPDYLLDHDLIVLMYEAAFPRDGFDEGKFMELESYLRSKTHREAVAETVKERDISKSDLSRRDQTLQMVIYAERKLAALPDPLPTQNLHKKLGVSKEFLRKLMLGKERTKATVRQALREKLYELAPQRRPRKKLLPAGEKA